MQTGEVDFKIFFGDSLNALLSIKNLEILNNSGETPQSHKQRPLDR